MMATFIVGPEGVVVGVDAAVVGVVLTVGEGAVDPLVVAFPQAASRTRAPSVNRQNQLRIHNFAENVFLCIFLLLSRNVLR